MVPDLEGLTLYLERQFRPTKHYVLKKEIQTKCRIDGKDFLNVSGVRGKKSIC